MELIINKKYIVRLDDAERKELTEVVKKLRGSSQKVVRAQILLKADADGPNWTHQKIARSLFLSHSNSGRCQ